MVLPLQTCNQILRLLPITKMKLRQKRTQKLIKMKSQITGFLVYVVNVSILV